MSQNQKKRKLESTPAKEVDGSKNEKKIKNKTPEKNANNNNNNNKANKSPKSNTPNKKTPEKKNTENKKTPDKNTNNNKTPPEKHKKSGNNTPTLENKKARKKESAKEEEDPHVRHSFSSTPWSYWNEWKSVYSLLFSDNPNERRLGVARVTTWRTRETSLPVSVECTAGLVEASLFDSELSTDKSFLSFQSHQFSSESIKLLYSTSITRLVNGILDSKQIAHFSVPLSQLAAENSFPQTLVDLRHQVSHYSQLPSLLVLRNAAKTGLDWLKERYWERQTNSLQNLNQSIFQTLKNYEDIVSKIGSSVVRIGEVKRCLEEITTIANPNLVQEVLVPLLLSNNSDQYRPFLLPPGKYPNGIPQDVLLLWHIALRKFSHAWTHFPLALMLALVNQTIESCADPSALEKESSAYELNALRFAWISHILRNYFPLTFFGKSHQSSKGSNSILSIANLCLKNLNHWTKQILTTVLKYSNEIATTGVGSESKDNTKQWDILKDITDLKKITDSLRERHKGEMRNLHKINTASLPGESREPKTIEFLEQLVTPSSLARVTSEKEETWSLSTQYPTSTPLGVLPNGEFPNLDLPASLDNYKLARFLTTAQRTLASHTDERVNDSPAVEIITETANVVLTTEIEEITGSQSSHHANGDVDEEDKSMSELESGIPEKPQCSVTNVGNLFSAYKELFV